MFENRMTVTHSEVTWQIVVAICAICTLLLAIAGGIIVKIFNLGKVSHRLKTVESDVKGLKKDIGDTRKEITKRIDDVLLSIANPSSSKLIESRSPSRLTDEGLKIVAESGMDKILESNFDIIVAKVKAADPKNAYQAEDVILKEVRGLIHDDRFSDDIEKAAFESGQPIGLILIVGAIFIRDKVIQELGWTPEDIDKHTPGLANNQKPNSK